MNCFIVQLLGCAVLLFAWPSVSSTAGFLAWIVIYGVFGGAGISGVPAGLGSISRHHMHEVHPFHFGCRADDCSSGNVPASCSPSRACRPSSVRRAPFVTATDAHRPANRRSDPRKRGLPRLVDLGRRFLPGGRSARHALAGHFSAKSAALARVVDSVQVYIRPGAQ